MARARKLLQPEPERELRELREYLGSAYDHSRLVRHREVVAEEYHRIRDEMSLYRASEAYLYDLTAFAMSGTKTPYLEALVRAVPPPAKVLDFGCGIGSDGLLLLDAGYDVAFADFDNPSTRYLRWRLARRERDAPVYDLDRDEVPGGFDAAYAFDVIEHVPDPFAFVGELERRARVVVVNFLETGPKEVGLHRELPIDGLVRHAAGKELLRYELHHGRSHLVVYRPKRTSGASATRVRLALWRGLAHRHLRQAVRRVAEHHRARAAR